MVRLKFLVFAFLVIGLGLAHLPVLSGPLRTRAEEGAAAQATAATAEVSRRVDARRAQVQSLALKLAATPEVVAAVRELQPAARPAAPAPRNPRGPKPPQAEEPAGPQPLTLERFSAVRAAAEAVLPKELQGTVVALVARDVQFHAVAGGEPSSDAAKLDVAALAQAGVTVVDALGGPHAFASVPLLWSGEKPLATLVVGAPLLDADVLEAAVTASGAAGLALVKGEAVVAGAGKEKALAESSPGQVKAGAGNVVLRRGHLASMGPLLLPALTDGDAMGGKAPLMVGTRQALEGTGLEVLAVAGTQAVLGTLAAYQQSALMGLGGLLLLTVLWTVLMGSGRSGGDEVVKGNSDTLSLSAAMAAAAAQAPQQAAAEPQPSAPAADPFAMPAPPPAAQPQQADPFAMPAPPPVADPFASAAPAQMPLADPFAMPAPPPAADPFAMPAPPPAAPAADPFSAADPFASADAFPFPAPPVATPAPAPFAAASAMPFEPDPAAFPPAEPLSPASPRRGAFAFEDQPTAAYSLQQAADPFSLAAAQTPDNPETTRVAAIPQELLKASARPPTQEAIPMPPPRSTGSQAAIPLPGLGNSAVALSEEQHFQEVFREFVTTRERCGEPADGLTYDKFVQKLRKNKEQLVQKYACKTVRFQVYVKEGKAALKATPVKD
jgi:hypothetical protein